MPVASWSGDSPCKPSRLGGHEIQQSGQDNFPEATPIEWAPPPSPMSPGYVYGVAGSDGSSVSDARSSAGASSSVRITHKALECDAPEADAPKGQATRPGQQQSEPLLFPQLEPIGRPRREDENDGHASLAEEENESDQEPSEEEKAKSAGLLERLLQAEQGLAEKDSRIEALEECTARLAERLALAEGLRAKGSREHQDPGTPGSNRSTSASTVWTSSDVGQFKLPRNHTVDSDSLGSIGSMTGPNTPQSRSRGLLPLSADAVAAKRKQQARGWGAAGRAYASAADVDMVCRRSEQLLKAMTAAVATSDRTAVPRRVEASRSGGHSSPRLGWEAVKADLDAIGLPSSTRSRARRHTTKG
mmetsp:Transcript_4817/g.8578  ORF Transcript_4817/g.8578 Transcript_4817/m.8578 type:complete len:360 (+) Transcript_4817:69-1148(+)